MGYPLPPRTFTRTCRKCQTKFIARSPRKAFCESCSIARECPNCGKSLANAPPRRKCCSFRCSALWQMKNGGLKHLRDKWPLMHTPEARRKAAQKKRDRPWPERSGPRHHNWKGGVSFTRRNDTSEYKRWRRAVLQRDKFTCQDCGTVGCRLNAHHILTYGDRPDLALVAENGIALCVPCHHKRHGREFFSNAANKRWRGIE